jgi:hypothetical protein
MSANGIGNRSRTNANDLIIAALAAGKSAQEAADAAGVSGRTVARRLADPTFRLRVQTTRGEMVGRALGRMADGMSEAADVLRGLLRADAESVRLGAARALIDLGSKLRDSVELEQRIAALEARGKS